MQWFTVAWWRWRLAQARGRSPLVRTSDRIEVAVMSLAVAVSLAAVPIAGAIGTAVHDDQSRVYAAEQQSRHRVAATATKDSAGSPKGPVAVVQARRQAGDVENAGAFTWDSPVKNGDSVDIWVDRARTSGRRARSVLAGRCRRRRRSSGDLASGDGDGRATCRPRSAGPQARPLRGMEPRHRQPCPRRWRQNQPPPVRWAFPTPWCPSRPTVTTWQNSHPRSSSRIRRRRSSVSSIRPCGSCWARRLRVPHASR